MGHENIHHKHGVLTCTLDTLAGPHRISLAGLHMELEKQHIDR